MRTAFVLSGGGSLGAVQVGMLRSLAERGWQPDFLVGVSAGALNAAFIAGPFGDVPVEDLERIWRRCAGPTCSRSPRRATSSPSPAPARRFAHPTGCRTSSRSTCRSSVSTDAAIPVHVVTHRRAVGHRGPAVGR